ncbi:MAG: hypothetical protein ACLPY5_03365 [Candidatus Bathyarchaeia archaeon]
MNLKVLALIRKTSTDGINQAIEDVGEFHRFRQLDEGIEFEIRIRRRWLLPHKKETLRFLRRLKTGDEIGVLQLGDKVAIRKVE